MRSSAPVRRFSIRSALLLSALHRLLAVAVVVCLMWLLSGWALGWL